MDSSLATALISNAGIAGIVIVLILLGQLVPRAYYQRILAEADRLRQANDTLTAANIQLRESNTALTSSTALTNQALTTMRDIATAQRALAPVPDPVPSPPAQKAP